MTAVDKAIEEESRQKMHSDTLKSEQAKAKQKSEHEFKFKRWMIVGAVILVAILLTFLFLSKCEEDDEGLCRAKKGVEDFLTGFGNLAMELGGFMTGIAGLLIAALVSVGVAKVWKQWSGKTITESLSNKIKLIAEASKTSGVEAGKELIADMNRRLLKHGIAIDPAHFPYEIKVKGNANPVSMEDAVKEISDGKVTGDTLVEYKKAMEEAEKKVREGGGKGGLMELAKRSKLPKLIHR